MARKRYNDGKEYLLTVRLDQAVWVDKRTHLQVIPGGAVIPARDPAPTNYSMVAHSSILEIAGGEVEGGGSTEAVSGKSAVVCESKGSFWGVTGSLSARGSTTATIGSAALEMQEGMAEVHAGMSLAGGSGVTLGGAGLQFTKSTASASVRGGDVTGGSANTTGGSAVLLQSSAATARLHGGTFQGGHGGTRGGNGVTVYGGNAYISGGEVKAGTGGTSGGFAVGCHGGHVGIMGGELSGGIAAVGAGSTVSIYGASLVMKSGRIIGTLKDGTAIAVPYLELERGKITLFNQSDQVDPDPPRPDPDLVRALEALHPPPSELGEAPTGDR